jgi:hypothetical protein
MKAFRSEVLIAAPPSRVWSVLTDFPRWGEWNTVVVSVHGEPRPDASLRLGVRSALFLPSLAMPIWTRIIRFTPEREIRWSGGVPRVFAAEHGFALTPDGSGTRVFHEECFDGAMVSLLAKRLDRALPATYEEMNRGLKAHCEVTVS